MGNVGNVGFGAMQIIVFEKKENTSCQLNEITTGKRDCWIFTSQHVMELFDK